MTRPNADTGIDLAPIVDEGHRECAHTGLHYGDRKTGRT